MREFSIILDLMFLEMDSYIKHDSKTFYAFVNNTNILIWIEGIYC